MQDNHDTPSGNATGAPDEVAVSGVVKWFDPVKGFGFVVADTGGPDILLHVNVLRNFGQSSVADGARVEVLAHRTERGVQATEVRAIQPPQNTQTAVLPDILGRDREEVEAAPLVPARVKWFDKSKGFGFANVFGKPQDVFLHIEVLRQSGLSDLQPGEALAMRVIEGKRGKMAAEVQAWETVLTEREDDRD
ncbi:cold-shock protein [Sulfitobacter alexandrii]|uniref:cold-shock protein n=1 Tax=Sulfitobacter alexandrii TaxID=1917485 RepID=UPI000AFDD628